MTGSREQLEELSGLSPSSGVSWDTPGEDSASGFSSAKSRGRDRQEPAEQGGAQCPCRPRGQGGFPAGVDWRCSVCSLSGYLGRCSWSRVITASLRLSEIHRPDSQRSTAQTHGDPPRLVLFFRGGGRGSSQTSVVSLPGDLTHSFGLLGGARHAVHIYERNIKYKSLSLNTIKRVSRTGNRNFYLPHLL